MAKANPKTSTKLNKTSSKAKRSKWVTIGLPALALILVATVGTIVVKKSNAASGTFNYISTIQGHNCITTGKYPPTIRQGSRGECVKAFQLGINNWRAFRAWTSGGKIPYKPIATDGIFGSTTTAAAKEYQSGNGLTADGIVGQSTWSSFLTNCAVTNTCQALNGQK